MEKKWSHEGPLSLIYPILGIATKGANIRLGVAHNSGVNSEMGG
jgi:hypothetical protein